MRARACVCARVRVCECVTQYSECARELDAESIDGSQECKRKGVGGCKQQYSKVSQTELTAGVLAKCCPASTCYPHRALLIQPQHKLCVFVRVCVCVCVCTLVYACIDLCVCSDHV